MYVRRFAILIAALTLSVSCKRERPPVQLAQHEPVQIPTPTPDVSVEPVEPPVRLWSGRPSHRGGIDFQMTRAGANLILSHGDAEIVLRDVPTPGDCVTSLPETPISDDFPLRDLRDSPAWWALHGDGESAAIRLSTHGALLVVNDGCQRVADVTPLLLGTPPDSDDPLFSADQLAPEAATEDPSATIRLKPNSASVDHRGRRVAITFRGADPTISVLTRDDRSWIRFVAASDRPLRGPDATAGREHTLVWTATGNDPLILALDNDFHYGSDGPDHEDRRVSAFRARPQPRGILHVRGTRAAIDDAMNVGAGRCPEMEGVLAFKHRDETVQWSFTTPAGKVIPLGDASRRGTFASGCLDDAKREVRRRKHLLADQSSDTPVRWEATNAPASDAPNVGQSN